MRIKDPYPPEKEKTLISLDKDQLRPAFATSCHFKAQVVPAADAEAPA
jgi:hypothetical protein